MLKGIRLKLYPNHSQRQHLQENFGNTRKVWNVLLAMMNERYQNSPDLPYLNNYALDLLLKPLKQEFPYLKNTDSSSYQVVTGNLNRAWQSFFKDKTGTVGKPEFHSRKYAKQSSTTKSTVKVIAKRYVQLPLLGVMKVSKPAG
jgi:Transposase and inactivated derivatives